MLLDYATLCIYDVFGKDTVIMGDENTSLKSSWFAREQIISNSNSQRIISTKK